MAGAMALTPDGLPETSLWQTGCFTVQVLAPVSCPWTKSLVQGHTACGESVQDSELAGCLSDLSSDFFSSQTNDSN